MAGEFAAVSDKNRHEMTLKEIRRLARSYFIDQLGLRLVAIDVNSLVAELPVRLQVAGSNGRLQAGIAVAIAEALGTLASHAVMGRQAYVADCLDVSANHCGCVTVGEILRITVMAQSLSHRMHDWEIHLRADDGRLVCVAKLRVAIKLQARDAVHVAA